MMRRPSVDHSAVNAPLSKVSLIGGRPPRMVNPEVARKVQGEAAAIRRNARELLVSSRSAGMIGPRSRPSRPTQTTPRVDERRRRRVRKPACRCLRALKLAPAVGLVPMLS